MMDSNNTSSIVRCPLCQEKMLIIGCNTKMTPKNISLPFIVYECAKCGEKVEKVILPIADALI